MANFVSQQPESLFNADILKEFSVDVPEGLLLRPLCIKDYDTGFLELLSQLTTVGPVSRDQFETRFNTMRDTRPNMYFVVVLENKNDSRVVGAATLVVEWKFIHEAGSRGRVEDVVVDSSMRGRKLGALLNRVLVGIAKEIGVYKLSLECKDSLIPFYELFGYKKAENNNFLVQRFGPDPSRVIIPSNL